jgi:hypothetical protein
MVTELAAAVTGGMALLGIGIWAASARAEAMTKEERRMSVRIETS